MNRELRIALQAAVGAIALAVASASAQPYARGDAVWNTTNTAVPGAAECLSCHMAPAATAPLSTLKSRFAALTQAQVRTRIDQAFAGSVGGTGPATGMQFVYPANTINGNDRDALAIFFGNFIPSATVGASTPLTALTAVSVGATAESTLTITNTGANALVISNMVFSGTDAPQFSRVPTGTPCVASIAAAASCQEFIRFTPTSTGTKSVTLTISHDRNPLGAALPVSGSTNVGAPPPIGGGVPSGGGGGAVWPGMLLLIGAAALRRRLN